MSDSSHHRPGSDSGDSEHHHSDSHSAPTTVSGEHTTAAKSASTSELHDHAREKKRRRPALACEQCRKRKVRCDRNKPCGPCLKGRIAPCTYAPTHVPAARGTKKKAATQDGPESASGSTDASSGVVPTDSRLIQDPTAVRQLELRPALATRRESFEGVWATLKGVLPPPEGYSPSGKPTSVEASTPDKSSDIDWLVQRVNFLQEKLHMVTKDPNDDAGPKKWPGHATLQHQEKGKIVKTRYYSCGHWMHGAYLFPTELSILVHAESTKDEVYWNLTRCKDLARTIKESRLQPLLSTNIGQSLPNRVLADQLLENYIRAFEGQTRILHIPSFRAEYERLWQSPESAGQPFIMQVQLCLAIGAALYDDTFTLRQTAMQWVYEAQLWMMLPPEKDRITYMGMQIMCLICLARTVCSVGADLSWLGGGQLSRMAIYMGLHRDPRKLGVMSVYRAEMRRRLWATVMELDCQFAIDAGASSSMDSMDYDTLPPANLNDDQLTDDPEKERAPGTEIPTLQVATQTSVQIALHRSLPVRLAILRHINGTQGDDSYNATLGLNSRLTKECRLLTKILNELRESSTNPTSPINTFHVNMSEIGLYRFFHTLHQPMIIQSLEDPRFYFSRKMFLDSALKAAHICGLTPRKEDEGSRPQTLSELDFHRFLNNGAGMIRNVVAQSMMGVGLRIISLKEEQSLTLGYFSTGFDEGLGSKELMVYLQRTMELAKRRIRSGETGVKMLAFVSAAMARCELTEQGADRAVLHKAILEKATEASRIGLELLKERAVLEGTPLPAENAENSNIDMGSGGFGSGTPGFGLNMGPGVPTIFGSLQALNSGLGDGMDWMTDWAWDDMSEFGWPAGGAPTQQGFDQGMPAGPIDPSQTMDM